MSEVGLLKEGRKKEGQSKAELYIEVTNDIQLKKGDKIFLNDPKDYPKYLLSRDDISDAQRSWAEKQVEGFTEIDPNTGKTKLHFIKKRLALGKRS